MEAPRILDLGQSDDELDDELDDNLDNNLDADVSEESEASSDDSSSQSSDDSFDNDIIRGLSGAIDPNSSDEENVKGIVEAVKTAFNDEFEHSSIFFPLELATKDHKRDLPCYLTKDRLFKKYTALLNDSHRRLKRAINLGISFLPEHEQIDCLEQLEQVLDATLELFGSQRWDMKIESFTSMYYRQRQGLQLGPRLPGPVPPLPFAAVPVAQRARKEIVEFRRIWNHFTISRDETSANNFSRELLYAILSPHINSESGQRHDRFVSETAAETTFEYQRNQTIQSNVSNPQLHKAHRQKALSDQQNRSLLEAQKVRLQHTRQNMLLEAASKQIPAPLRQLTGEPVVHANMAREEPGSEALPHTGSGNTILRGDEINYQIARKHDVRDSPTEHLNLKHRIASLEQENKRLKTNQAIIPRCQVLYFIKNEASTGKRPSANAPPISVAYLDEPTWSVGPTGEIMLRANFPIPDVNGFLQQRPDIAFVVSYYYSSKSQENEVQNAARAKRVLPQPKHTSEVLRLHSPDLIEAVESFLALQPKFSEEFPSLNIRGSIHAPYLFWYHYRSPTALDVLSPFHRDTMQLLTAWIEEHYAKTFDRVGDQLKRGVISEDTMSFLVKPGDVLVWKENHEINAVVARGWPTRKLLNVGSQERIDKEKDWTRDGGTSEKRKLIWNVDSWNFRYDGNFYRKERQVEIILISDQSEDEVRIEELNIHPLIYAEPQFKSALENRGTLFWRCRHQYLVSYENFPDGNQRNEQNNGERFMIDFDTYRQLHSSSHAFKKSYPSIDDKECQRMDSDTMKSDEPPSAPDIYVFPNTIPGYNLRSKKWVDLKVDMIRDVTWNKKSFDHLVVDDETKELVQALVKHQISGEKSTDIIDRKGNGLIILLHGGPGTGKTFTAESVAEMAEKPLFRITCGDIGTEPEKVENYLDSVLHLGKIWDCIVLIDEAEVFLEQRNLNNLERNALVSVFLRVLEYYEGILILTSNRVGTFDEAFKSRILLSLHYEILGEGQRTKIWKNFFKRLKEMAEKDDKDDASQSISSVIEPGSRKRKFQGSTEGVDFDDVECYITELAKHELNGRQIRNVITTARQLAVSRNELMRYKHLEHVIKVSSKFDNYLRTVREGFSDDQVARDEGIR